MLLPNALIYALAIIAYAGFDVVLVGLVYTLVTTLAIVSILVILLIQRKKILYLPVTNYMALTYTIGAIVSCIVRFVILHQTVW